jgi:elongation factor Ts
MSTGATRACGAHRSPPTRSPGRENRTRGESTDKLMRNELMAGFSAQDVKKLRDATGAGMMDAKKALTEADGDFDKATELLRISGQAKAAKRGAERSASNGLVVFAEGALVQLGAETDFVAKNAEFQALADDVVKAVAAAKADSVEAANAAPLASGKTVAEAVSELSATIGEKLEIANAAYFDGQTAVYLHKRASDLPPSVGVLVEYTGEGDAAAEAPVEAAAVTDAGAEALQQVQADAAEGVAEVVANEQAGQA